MIIMTSNGQSQEANELVLAKWSSRFLAWLIDFIIVSIAVWSIFGPSLVTFDGNHPDRWFNAVGPLPFVGNSLVFFGYWTLMESARGQSIGKMALRIKTTSLEGKTADLKSVAIQSFGKSFLLVIDVILGWIFTNDKRQRIFNRAGNTIVIKLKENSDTAPDNICYKKE